jgi:ADP-ribosyl-[dinitrogen reductase] hydrolase
MLTTIDRAIGCMIGGAGGDSLGAAVEFLSLSQILRRYGPKGVLDLQPAFDLPAGVITDDTQQAHAVAEGLIASKLDGSTVESIRSHVWSELKRWHLTQSDPQQNRSPGGTSMGSLRGSRPGELHDPLNSSDSCGSVMRVHPVGIALAGKPEAAFWAGMEVSVLPKP